MDHICIDLPNTNNKWLGFRLANIDIFIIRVGFRLMNVDTIRMLTLRGPNPSFIFLTQGTLPAHLRIRKKTNLSCCLNIFKSESVERTHLYSYVFH